MQTKQENQLEINNNIGTAGYARTVGEDGKSYRTGISSLVSGAIGGDIEQLENDVENLQTAVETNATAVGTLANLTTTEKSNLVGAINEVNADVSDVKEDFNQINNVVSATANNEIIKEFCGSNPVYSAGASENVVNLQKNQDYDYSSIIRYRGLGFVPLAGSGQMCYFSPPFVSGEKYKLYLHFYGDFYDGASVYSNIRVFRGATLISGNYFANGEKTEVFEFTSDGTEKIRFYIWNKDVFKVYSVIAIADTSTFSTKFSNMLNSVIGSPLKNAGHITTSNYNTLIPDLNDAPVNTYYTGYTGDATKLPEHCPLSTTVPFVVKTYGTSGYLVFQEFTIYNNNTPQVNPSVYSGNTWVRCLTGSPGSRTQFYNWVSAGSGFQSQINSIKSAVRPVITVNKSATADEDNLLYTNFYKAMKTAYNNLYDVHVMAGDYDIVDEYIAVEGQSAYDNINNAWVGVPIGHGMSVKCDAEAFFTFKNTSAKSQNYLTIGQWFSPILPLDGGFRLEGFNCSAKNARYVIHDGGYNNSNDFCNHEIINCQLELDNTDFEGQPGLQTYRQCIGGGLLSGGIHVIVKDCIFDSENVLDNAGIVSYHNVSDTAEGADSYNTYDISGCYCNSGTIRCTYHGTETPVSPFKVHDNYIRSAPIFGAEASGDAIVNMKLFAWGNTIEASN